MIKSIKRLALLFVAAATMLNVSCGKDEPEQKPEPETPQIMNLVGTTWKFYYEGDVQGVELTMTDELTIFSADSLNRHVAAVIAGQAREQNSTLHYTWDGTTLALTGTSIVLTYRESDNVFFRAPEDDPEMAQIMNMLGITELVYEKQ